MRLRPLVTLSSTVLTGRVGAAVGRVVTSRAVVISSSACRPSVEGWCADNRL